MRIPACWMKASLCGAALILFSQAVRAQEWPQWRGPKRDGVVANFTAPATWPASLKLKWKTPVGGGYSSPVVAQGKVYLHTRQDEQEAVSCLDLATGKVLWSQRYPVPFTKNQYAVKHGKGPNSTPVLHGDRLYTLGVSAVLSCWDARTGALKWRKDFSGQIDTSKLFCGTAMSPVIEGSLLIVHIGDDRAGAMIAFDAVTGAEKWNWRGAGPGYASPIVVDLAGVRQVVTLTDKSVIGVAAATGKLLWSLPWPDEWNENIVSPILYDQTLILSGIRKGTVAVKVARNGDSYAVNEVWSNKEVSMYLSTPILDGHLLFGLSQRRKGQFFCLDARTGKALWMTEGRDAENAAILKAGELLFFQTTDGALIVAKKSEKGFEQITRYTVADSPTWSHPVILGKQILVKDAATIALWSME